MHPNSIYIKQSQIICSGNASPNPQRKKAAKMWKMYLFLQQSGGECSSRAQTQGSLCILVPSSLNLEHSNQDAVHAFLCHIKHAQTKTPGGDQRHHNRLKCCVQEVQGSVLAGLSSSRSQSLKHKTGSSIIRCSPKRKNEPKSTMNPNLNTELAAFLFLAVHRLAALALSSEHWGLSKYALGMGENLFYAPYSILSSIQHSEMYMHFLVCSVQWAIILVELQPKPKSHSLLRWTKAPRRNANSRTKTWKGQGCEPETSWWKESKETFVSNGSTRGHRHEVVHERLPRSYYKPRPF